MTRKLASILWASLKRAFAPTFLSRVHIGKKPSDPNRTERRRAEKLLASADRIADGVTMSRLVRAVATMDEAFQWPTKELITLSLVQQRLIEWLLADRALSLGQQPPGVTPDALIEIMRMQIADRLQTLQISNDDPGIMAASAYELGNYFEEILQTSGRGLPSGRQGDVLIGPVLEKL